MESFAGLSDESLVIGEGDGGRRLGRWRGCVLSGGLATDLERRLSVPALQQRVGSVSKIKTIANVGMTL